MVTQTERALSNVRPASPDPAPPRRPRLLAEAELAQIAAAGSKPGGAGDGRGDQ